MVKEGRRRQEKGRRWSVNKMGLCVCVCLAAQISDVVPDVDAEEERVCGGSLSLCAWEFDLDSFLFYRKQNRSSRVCVLSRL